MSISSWTRVCLIAENTFREAVRQKFFNAILLIALMLVLSSTFFQQFDFGMGELKFILDFGFGSLFFFGSILAVTVTTQLFFSEIENRTALTVLAKPVHRLEFLAGKFVGVQFLMFSFVAILSLVLVTILLWRESALIRVLGVEALVEESMLRYGDILLFGFLQCLKFGVLSAITLFVASFSNTNLYTIVVSFFVLVICQLQYIARDAYSDLEHGFVRLFVQGIGLVFPNFQLFNVGDQLVFRGKEALPVDTVLQITGYSIVYMVTFILLAQLNFRRREI